MTEWSDIDLAREINIGLDSLNWPEGTAPDLIEHLRASLKSKRLREVVVHQMYDEWRGFRIGGHSLRDNNLTLAISSYYAFFVDEMEHIMETATNQRYRQHLVEVTVLLLSEDPTGFSAAEFLERRCRNEFGGHSPVDFGVKKAVVRYKELYEALVKAGATPDMV